MKKYFCALLLIAFVTPSIAFASWWNPLTWKVFQNPNKAKVENVQKIDQLQNVLDQKKEIERLSRELEDIKKQQTTPLSVEKKSVPAQTQPAKPESIPSVKMVNTISQINSTDLVTCNGKKYTDSCPVDTKFFCPETCTAYCANPFQMYMNELEQKEEAKAKAEKDRKNSPECKSATVALNAIKKEIKPIQDKLDKYYDDYLTTGNYHDTSELNSKRADLSIRESGLQSKYYAACEDFYPTPSNIYSTNCYGFGDSFHCTTY